MSVQNSSYDILGTANLDLQLYSRIHICIYASSYCYLGLLQYFIVETGLLHKTIGSWRDPAGDDAPQ